MTIKEIYELAVKMGREADFRSKDYLDKMLSRRQEKFAKMSDDEKAEFDRESLANPYSDSRIVNIAGDKEIKKVLVGIDIDSAEVLLAKELGNIDLIIGHHPLGRALADIHEVMELQCDVLEQYGVPINVAEGLMRERISEIARRVSPINHQQAVDTAKLLGMSLMCLHTVCDNMAAKFLKDKIEAAEPFDRLEDLLKFLKDIPEYREAIKLGSGPKIFVGNPENRCGKIALTEITGGTEGSPKLFEKMAIAGIGTVVGMHISEEGKKEAETANINVVIAGHISSDSLGVNLFLDELQKQGIEIVSCSGMIRIVR
ncbi:MAG: NGG1p interacting factor NIF3 [bacterium]|nr:NGG1p interacting factor NIF3 [bacterium]